MKKFLLRFLVAAIAFPVLWLLTFKMNGYNFIGMHMIVTLFTTLGAFEVANFFEKAKIPTYKYFAPILSATLPAAAYIGQYVFHSGSAVYEWFVIAACFIVVRTCFPISRKDFSNTLAAAASSVFIIVYPGLLSIFIVRMFDFENPAYIFALFLVLTFINEIAAYLFGKLFGGKTKLDLPISPNKTLVGFIAGFVFSILTAGIFYALFPFVFHAHIAAVLTLGAVVGIAAIFGDLFESALKRSCNIKDSGAAMAGRGGIMDTIDSILLSAPLFYFIYSLMS
jgi:phosphatidate cytidylyltransferase